jgi:hypothetical protein
MADLVIAECQLDKSADHYTTWQILELPFEILHRTNSLTESVLPHCVMQKRTSSIL